MKPKKFVLVSDNHGDLQDDSAVRACLNFCNDFKPDVAIHMGDNWDFRNLRRGASDDEKSGSLEDDYKTGLEFFEEFFSYGKTRVFLRGNHDQRVWHLIDTTNGILRDHCRYLAERIETACKVRKVEMLPYDAEQGVYEIGELRCLHGYAHGVNACRVHANVYRNCFFGHIHTAESNPVPSHKPAEARSIGCLCKRDIDYINAKTAKLRWANGWVYGYLFDNGTYQYSQAKKINGHFAVTTDLKLY